MSATLPVEPETHRVLWTREAVACLADAGMLDPERYELFDGELIEKVKNRRHTITLRRVRQALLAYFDEEYLQSEAPIQMPSDTQVSAPEPDLAVLRRPDVEFQESDPGPEDIALVVEVADTTLHRDLGRKAARYARAGIAEYWVVDVEGRRVIVHRTPEGEAWQSIASFDETEAIFPLFNPEATILLSEVFAISPNPSSAAEEGPKPRYEAQGEMPQGAAR